MNLGEIKLAVKRQFGDESGAQINDTDIVRWANDATLDIARNAEGIYKRTTVSTTGLDNYAVPADFMFMRRVTYGGRWLSPISPQELDRRFPHRDVPGYGTTGEPEYYYVQGNSIYLYPVPGSGSNNLALSYVARPAQLVNDADIPEIPVEMHEAIVRFAFMRAKELDEDWTAAKEIAAEYENKLNSYRHDSQTDDSDHYPVVRDYDEDW